MKKLTLLLLISLSINTFSQEQSIMDKPKVDNRIEMLSIVFKLIGSQEYNNSPFKLYTDKIDQHFAPYKEHELIKFASELRNEKGVSYDAVMAMAIHLDDNLNPRVEFSDKLPERRWGKENAYKFVELLKEFYKDARCEEFFNSNTDLYNETARRCLPIYDELDLKWYSSFYGKEPSEKFKFVIGAVNGGSNYGGEVTLPSGEKEVYAIMGTWRVDSIGMPIFMKEWFFSTLVHEFNHSFVNYLTDKNEEAFKENGEKIFVKVKDIMAKQAYANWKTVLNEALVRAAVIKYMKDHNFDQTMIAQGTGEQLSRGFIWIRELVEELEKYDKNRSSYPTLESYMPKMVEAYAKYAENMDKYAEQIQDEKPKVVSIDGITNGDMSVDTTIKTITINFDKPLLGRGYSISYGKKGKDAFPKFESITYANDNKSVVLNVNLENNKEYQFVLFGKAFMSQSGIGIDNYEVSFKTK